MEIDIVYLGSEEKVFEILENIEEGDIAVDSLFGTGGNRALGGIEKLLIDKLNSLNIIRIAIDIPSGLSSKINDFENINICFKAHETYTICFAKDIFFLYETREYIGKLFIIKSIFPKEILDNSEYKALLINYNDKKLREEIKRKRNAFFSKREQGNLAIVAGSSDYIGAAVLSVNASLQKRSWIYKVICSKRNCRNCQKYNYSSNARSRYYRSRRR